MTDNKKKTMTKLIAVFLLSTSLFIYEILSTRLLSTIIPYHYVFISISLSILGIGLGGVIVYKGKKDYSLSNLSFLLFITYLGSVLTVYILPYINLFAFYSILLSMPFIIGGMILSFVFLKESTK